MVVHVDIDDLEFLLNQLQIALDGIDDENDPFYKECLKLIDRVDKKIEQANIRAARAFVRELQKGRYFLMNGED